MLMEGTIQGEALAGVFEALAGENRTGILTVQGGDEIIAVSLSAGHVVSADALNRSVDDGLGEILIERKLVDAGDFSVLVSEQQAGGGRVVDLLVERSFLERSKLLEVLRDYHYRLLIDPFRWDEGEFRFYEGEEVAFEEGIESISIPELLVRVSLDLPDRAPVRPLPSLDDRYELAPRQPDAAPTTVNENLLISQLSEPRSVRELAAASDVSEYEALYYVRRLTVEGYLVLRPEPQEEPVAEEPVAAPVVLEDEEQLLTDSAIMEPVVETPAIELPAEPIEEVEEAPARPPRERKRERPKRRRPAWLDRLPGLAGQALGALFVVVVLGQAFSGDGALETGLPVFVSDAESPTSRARRAALYRKLDRAMRTHFLNESEFPPDLQALVDQRLLSGRDLSDPTARTVAYSPMPAAYLLEDRALEGEDSAATVGIAGDLLLDPSSFAADDDAVEVARQPLILLD